MALSYSNSLKQLIVLSAANITLSSIQSGSIISFPGSANYTITLPPLQQGLNFVFIRNSAGNFTIQIAENAGTAVIFGGVIGGAAVTSSAGTATVRFVTANGAIGDSVQMYCDGTRWIATGMCAVAASITFV